ncbi:23S rRNA (adenine(1618)-N(6))-methyltransferase RlmF [Vibrio parahaemolyticus]|uniref:23S rRNA (adenine(1618)-N(6))-methyltransferase RlmF n=1 Tax=Vibrio parahaemolyticus TaxID=670 RepID=UPI0003F8C7FB|nr:23S rRNA (adenine(1618)-N(6))-methyltransferase RlmF [Vibrio parahaemolyticus]EGQ7836129.1 23S rRNA (adenine(1618)-N(6))-methyltransferase RlmF [Vibrio parahaemolyticus]EGQ8508035.1 23S rRNA (adenine(1618)-N(6))-methyltransferase RlmF [Vibrio parahaemolyticus]EGQ8514034.1 23S rRNA (adenine(1618)-N(6))-methyltransferase RlmF [Vibrio parahaemolyticus]EGQ9815723.1 23S rRNA (adenine(1618)-N(6))-methyltransferase RlmF [Vibrio parahaemolyticus]EGR2692927.1 23S rRNA (adenine(1618)-N(6))-methyltran
MKNNSHNAKQAPSKAAKPKRDNDVNKAKPKRVKKKAAVKAKLSAEKSDVDFIKIAKSGLHESNAHRGRYDFKKLIASEPALASFVIKNPKGEDSINFSDPNAVKMLNKALLAAYYDIDFWDIPEHYLCPPIPGRADYIHRLAELLDGEVKGKYRHQNVRALDVGVGANCIYPIVGVTQYGWHYTGSDVDPKSIESATDIVERNVALNGKIELVQQMSESHIYRGVIQPNDRFEVTTCNPPFHRSAEDAAMGSQRKLDNLKANQRKKGVKQQNSPVKQGKPTLNFGGQNAELWCEGGEAAFIRRMANESQAFSSQVLWFTTLISKKDNVRPMRKQLEKLGVKAIRVVEMSQGQKISRFMAWSFMDKQQRKTWIELK